MKRQAHIKFVGDPDHLEPKLALPEPVQAHPGQENCDICGLVGQGSYGFGSFLGVRGVIACSDLDCRAEAQARTAGQRNLIAAE